MLIVFSRKAHPFGLVRSGALATNRFKVLYSGFNPLGGANLIGADLSGANLSGTRLRGANLRGANLMSAIASLMRPPSERSTTAGIKSNEMKSRTAFADTNRVLPNFMITK
jgi:hypothetical protein